MMWEFPFNSSTWRRENVPTPQVPSLGNCLKPYRMNLELLLMLEISLTNQISFENPYPFWGPHLICWNDNPSTREGLSLRPAKSISSPYRTTFFLEVHNRFVSCFKRKQKFKGWHHLLHNPQRLEGERNVRETKNKQTTTKPNQQQNLSHFLFLFFSKHIFTWLYNFSATRNHMGS